jgi:uncharacterized protein (UPF0335 family)
MEKVNIVAVIQNTAKNMHELLMQIASHIEKLEEEKALLKDQLRSNQDEQ